MVKRNVRKFNPNFERDYAFYLNNRAVFSFAGTDTKKDYRIQFPGEPDEFADGERWAIPYMPNGKDAKHCFYYLDSEGKKFPCCEPELLNQLLTCKASVNLHIKMWAEGRAEYVLSLVELKEYMNEYKCPEWVFRAVENQKIKLLKQWGAEKKYNEHVFYRQAFDLHMGEALEEIAPIDRTIKPDKIIIIENSKPKSNVAPTLPMKVFEEKTEPMIIPTITLFRPTGGLEHELIRQSGYKRFPPRKSSQPIFYPVASEEYAVQIARDWNTKDEDNGNVGYVLKFNVRKDYLASYNIHIVGSSMHREYWIPAEHMDKFNQSIVGDIQVVHVFRNPKKKD
jgi:hypothetical protein